ncbi:MAG: hypothetical protein AB7E96_10370 [Deferribacterales bacterium]
MYVNYNAKSVGLQYDSYEKKSDSTKTTSKSVNVEIKYTAVSASVIHEDKADISDSETKALTDEAMSRAEAYIQESVNRLRERISQHTQNVMKGQSETVMAEIRSYSLSVKITLQSETTIENTDSGMQSLISEDGYFGVKKTSQRIFDFVSSMAGNNPEKLAEAKEAVQDGFDKAKGALGGDLPQISNDTYDAVMEKIDSYIDYLDHKSESAYA